MFQLSKEALEARGAEITTREIKQQPELWLETLQLYQSRQSKIDAFLNDILAKHEHVKVIFTGAGTSQYVGDTALPYLKQFGNRHQIEFSSVGTTDIVATPYEYFFKDEPTIVVSFARSGNSPESIATVDLANQIIDNVYHIFITCAPEGKLAQRAPENDNVLLLMMPERSNDAGFAMTGSYSCMLLTAVLVFDTTDLSTKEAHVKVASQLGESVIAREADIQKLVDLDFERIVYLGSGSLAGLTREAQLKVLELTAGRMTTIFDSSMGFRHGPKSFVNHKTIVFTFINNHPYTRLYDFDIINEISGDQIAVDTVAIGQVDTLEGFTGTTFAFDTTHVLPDAYLALPDVLFAQTISLLASIKVGNTPDTPSPSGTVNRVVKGVILHPYEQ
ncbi:SIS domain-containing protein [Carnobacteriaceae bacterium zg-ZUI252]|nr:SIS domain-containing protein [Carnobacteriaceae bacterium zg-ZUI252]